MPKIMDSEQVVWTPQMPDRRKNNRRNSVEHFQTNGKSLNISDMKNNERREVNERRKQVTLTITGRAIDEAE